MKTAIVLFTASMAVARIASAEVSTQGIIDDLQGQGFEAIEVVASGNQVKAEAMRGATRIEVVYDRSTGKILTQETARVRAGEDNAQGAATRTRTEETQTTATQTAQGTSPSDDDASDDASEDVGDDDATDDHGASASGSDDSSDDSSDDGDDSGSDDD